MAIFTLFGSFPLTTTTGKVYVYVNNGCDDELATRVVKNIFLKRHRMKLLEKDDKVLALVVKESAIDTYIVNHTTFSDMPFTPSDAKELGAKIFKTAVTYSTTQLFESIVVIDDNMSFVPRLIQRIYVLMLGTMSSLPLSMFSEPKTIALKFALEEPKSQP